MEKLDNLPKLPELSITEEMVYENPDLRELYWEQRAAHALAGEAIWVQLYFGNGWQTHDFYYEGDLRGQISGYDGEFYAYKFLGVREKASSISFPEIHWAKNFVEQMIEARLPHLPERVAYDYRQGALAEAGQD
jgi:hypothetical protein